MRLIRCSSERNTLGRTTAAIPKTYFLLLPVEDKCFHLNIQGVQKVLDTF